jgi:hypothetical protein
MRLSIAMNSANESLVALINRGYQVLRKIDLDYKSLKGASTYREEEDNKRYLELINTWAGDVIAELKRVFPTELETNTFLNPDIPFGAVSGDYRYQCMILNFKHHLRELDRVRRNSLPQYTDLPIKDRLYIEDIDSFQKVRDVNPAMVSSFLNNGYLNRSEDQVQLALEQILGVSFHKKDSAVELNDLFTANILVNGARRATAFLLKGPGIGKKEMTIADCGHNGDQVVRLFDTPADLFVVQYVGPVSDFLIKDVQGKTAQLQSKGRTAHFLVMDGQDTARVLKAYGKL